jgi:hypothetical protein
MTLNTEGSLLVGSNTTPYFYYNDCHLSEGDLALVHSGSHFGVVEVLQLIALDNHTALIKVKKPLLGRIEYTLKTYKESLSAIASHQQNAIKEEMRATVAKMLKGKKEIENLEEEEED